MGLQNNRIAKVRWLGDRMLATPRRSTGSNDAHAAAIAVELDLAGHQREERVIGTLADSLAGMEAIADLANQDIAGDHRFAAELLDAAALAQRVTPVAAGTLALFYVP